MTALEDLGVDTPRRGHWSGHWEEARLLHTLIDHIAPWWLRDSVVDVGPTADNNDARMTLVEAADMVQKAMARLGEMVGEGALAAKRMSMACHA